VVPPPDAPLSLNSPGHIAREVRRGCPDAGLGARPRRLGHVLLFTGDLERQLDFYTSVLGMKLTDRSRKVIVFLRCTTDHHNLAFLVSKGPGFHHGSFEVGNVDEIAMGAAKMQEARSEERRVGKEGRSRGWARHNKEKERREKGEDKHG